MANLEHLADGDRARVIFNPPRFENSIEISSAEGPVLAVAGMRYIQDETHRRAWAMPTILDLAGADVESVEVLEAADEIACRKACEARGDLVFPDLPDDPVEIEDALDHLAALIARETDTRVIRGRQSQLLAQFNDIAEHISLAATKRKYVLTRALTGGDFHPWETRDPHVFRNGTVRPLPADFELEPAARRDRPRRLEEAVRIFGEAEREVRNLLSALRAQGFDVRRPHPNAQEIRSRYRQGRAFVDLGLAPNANGLWQVIQIAPENKTKAVLLRKVLARSEKERLQTALMALV
ncbi:hypothetical protein ACGYLO_11170 [Sulfitobacter sp. 1A13353]|uniref:hypothetical protein n=1 Tax=Sulfitobacter sp. 1A13353 TaxID=3368568 RepID=UPI003745F578